MSSLGYVGTVARRCLCVAVWCWWDPQAFEYAPDGRGGYSMAECEQFALNPAVSCAAQ
jgi:hypothetical protein